MVGGGVRPMCPSIPIRNAAATWAVLWRHVANLTWSGLEAPAIVIFPSRASIAVSHSSHVLNLQNAQPLC